MTNSITPNDDENPDPELMLLLRQIADTPPLPMREEDVASLAHACAAEVRRQREQTEEAEHPKRLLDESNGRKGRFFGLFTYALSVLSREASADTLAATANNGSSEPQHGGMSIRIRIFTAIAASILLGLIAFGVARQLGLGSGSDVEFAEAPRVVPVNASGLLGSSANDAAANRISFLLPTVQRDSWVSVLQFRNGEWQLWTKTNKDCQFVEQNPDVVEESIPLEKIVVTRSVNHPTYMLFLWTERPSGAFLQKQLDTKSIPDFDNGNPQICIAEIARLIETSSNKLHYYRIEVIAPIPLKKGGGK